MPSLGPAGKSVSYNELDQNRANNASRRRPSCLGSGALSQPCSHWASQSMATLYPRMVAHPSPQSMTTGIDAERTHLERLEGRSLGSSPTHPCRTHPETRHICSNATVQLRCFTFRFLVPRPMSRCHQLPCRGSSHQVQSRTQRLMRACLDVRLSSSLLDGTINFDFRGPCRMSSSNRFIMLKS